ncbi:hypothetical protein IE53DRAFT_219240 [Violaceomyces palustris]|uniref:Uncharacterized protein n=1 Tax=Violaceomyces palustris TaxID=1673888 RepID=A0ACD0P528_9BASI|nr:hypothetical protein IE53DRAFT_219240 [Violaceomyces palustris]
MSQPKLSLRPPPHRDFIQGFPGIPSSSTRPSAHVEGTVEVRLGAKGQKAAWLRIELRKLETLPGGESWGELIGKGPIDVWTAKSDESYKSEDDKGWQLLQTADFPFRVPIPEGLPPSAKLEKAAGVAYELVTSLCVRSKKGLLKKETTSSIIQNTHPVWLEKHELHSMWPIYHMPDEHESIQDEIKVKVLRNQSCFGPGDQVDVRIIVMSEQVTPAKVKNVSFSVREMITLKGGAKRTFRSKDAAVQKTETLAQKSKAFGKKVYKGDVHTFDLSAHIPRTHTLMTIQTAKHIEVAYSIRVQVDVGKKPLVMDHIPITISNFASEVSRGMVQRIGYVPGLSEAVQEPLSSPSPYLGGSSSGAASILTRSQSFGGSSLSASTVTPTDLRRRDTVMTQNTIGTHYSGPGMAGRGVPGQIFSWGQYGAVQSYGQAEGPPRPAFAGPPSVYERSDLAPEENRALFHSSNRPQSALVLGVDPITLQQSVPGYGSKVDFGTIQEAQEGSSVGHHSSADQSRQAWSHGPNSPLQMRRTSSSSVPEASVHGQNHRGQQGLSQAAKSSAEAEKERLYERARQQAERNQRRADERRAQAAANAGRQEAGLSSSSSHPTGLGGEGQSRFSNLTPALDSSTASQRSVSAPLTAHLSAADEKARLYERARQEAEKYQAKYQQGASFPVNDLGVPSGGSINAHESSKRSSANYWVNGSNTDTSSHSAGSPSSKTSDVPPLANGNIMHSPVPAKAQTQSTPAAFLSAEEEKQRLYERAKAEAEAFQRGEQAPEQGETHQHGASSSSSSSVQVPGSWPGKSQNSYPTSSRLGLTTQSQMAAGFSSSSSTSVPAPAGTGSNPLVSAISEKEQLRRYYEAQEAVARHQAGESGTKTGFVGNGYQSGHVPYETAPVPVYHHQAQSSITSLSNSSHGLHRLSLAGEPTRVPASPDTSRNSAGFNSYPDSPFGSKPLMGAALNADAAVSGQTPTVATAPSPLQSNPVSLLTEAEQRSAKEKERLATHFAKKAAKAQAKEEARNQAAQTQFQGGNGHSASNKSNSDSNTGATSPASRVRSDSSPFSTPQTTGSIERMTPVGSYFENGRQTTSGSNTPNRRTSVVGGRPLPGIGRNQGQSPSISRSSSSTGDGIPAWTSSPTSQVGEKAQLAAYYAARDAAEETQRSLGSIQNHRIVSGNNPAANRPWSMADDGSSIYTEVLHDPEVLEGKKRAPPSITSTHLGYDSTETYGSGSGTTLMSSYPMGGGSRGENGPAYQHPPHHQQTGSERSSKSNDTFKPSIFREPPKPIPKDDPSLWRPRYDWVEEEEEEEEWLKKDYGFGGSIVESDPRKTGRGTHPNNPLPPLPPKVPLA